MHVFLTIIGLLFPLISFIRGYKKTSIVYGIGFVILLLTEKFGWFGELLAFFILVLPVYALGTLCLVIGFFEKRNKRRNHNGNR